MIFGLCRSGRSIRAYRVGQDPDEVLPCHRRLRLVENVTESHAWNTKDDTRLPPHVGPGEERLSPGPLREESDRHACVRYGEARRHPVLSGRDEAQWRWGLS